MDDEELNAYGVLLELRHKKTTDVNPTAPKHLLFNTFLFKQLWYLQKYSYHMVRRWTKNNDIFSMDTIFIPVNHANSHWVLVAVRVGAEAGTISFFDSLGSRLKQVPLTTRQWLMNEAKDKGKPQHEWTIEHPYCRQQENADECGVFTLVHMDLLARGMDHMAMTKSTAYYRCRIAAELLAGCLRGQG